MKQVAGRLRLDLAQYRELEAFAELGSELDKSSQAQLERGARVVEVLKQPQYRPLSVEQQVLSVYAVTNGYLDEVAIDDAKRWEEEFLAFVGTRYGDIGRTIVETGKLDDDLEAQVKKALDEFGQTFQPSEEPPPTTGGPGGGPVDERLEDVGWERVGEPEPGDEDQDRRDPGQAAPARTEGEEDFQERSGPASDTDAQPPPG
jgi:hypothetical protein